MSKPIDWVHWRRMERLPLGQAICLLLRINPESWLGRYVAKMSSTNDFSSSQRELYKKAKDMWDVAWASYHERSLNVRTGMGGASVSMGDWLGWAQAKNYRIPDELADLVPRDISEASLHPFDASRFAGGVTAADIAYDPRFAPAVTQGKREPELSASSETRRLSTLHRLVLAMAKAKYQWQPGEKNAATGTKAGSIYADIVEQLGEGRRVDADTIRRVLQEAADSFPGIE